MGHMGIASRGDEAATQHVAGGGIKSSGNCVWRLASHWKLWETHLTDHQVRIEFCRNWHHNLLECMHVVAITHSLVRPWDVDVPAIDVTLVPGSFSISQGHLLAESSASSAVMFISFGTRRVELSILVDMDRDVENIGVLVECFLDSISCVYVSMWTV